MKKLIGLLVLIVLVSGCTTNDSDLNSDIDTNSQLEIISENMGIGTPSEKTDPLIQSCLDDFNQCRSVAENKYIQYSFQVIEYQKFEDYESANEFYKKWGMGIVYYNLAKELNNIISIEQDEDEIENLEEDFFPVVLIATRLTMDVGDRSGSVPEVQVCDNSGKLINNLKNMCGGV